MKQIRFQNCHEKKFDQGYLPEAGNSRSTLWRRQQKQVQKNNGTVCCFGSGKISAPKRQFDELI
ncbi:MAG: hypothetical protein KTR26_05945 [Flammeovirgaceae bacterium]|nr:hypothetical protein [Flammeovirgaceae bacterium]